jgi:hypothetical protein
MARFGNERRKKKRKKEKKGEKKGGESEKRYKI